MSFEEEEEVVCRSGLDVSYTHEHGRNSLRDVCRDTILLPMSKMATSQLRLMKTCQLTLGFFLKNLISKTASG